MTDHMRGKLQQLLGLPDSVDWTPPPELSKRLDRWLQVRRRVRLVSEPTTEELAMFVALCPESVDGGKQSDARPAKAPTVPR
jgi:hypothetical protein